MNMQEMQMHLRDKNTHLLEVGVFKHIMFTTELFILSSILPSALQETEAEITSTDETV
jgi:hypothetical protein